MLKKERKLMNTPETAPKGRKCMKTREKGTWPENRDRQEIDAPIKAAKRRCSPNFAKSWSSQLAIYHLENNSYRPRKGNRTLLCVTVTGRALF